MNFRSVSLVLCLLVADATGTPAKEDCRVCHAENVRGAHGGLACASCHRRSVAPRGASRPAARACVQCHGDYGAVLHGPMAERGAERRFVEQALGAAAGEFWQSNCSSCHVSTCGDCHRGDVHSVERPTQAACHRCHRGYFVGADYYGWAPREDSTRYQRGVSFGGEAYLKMRPDVHAQAGLGCGDCHSMKSLAAGRKASKTCTDCHRPDPSVVAHRVPAHVTRLECYACHSAWTAQEYGTFFVRMADSSEREYFRVKQDPRNEYVKSSYLKKQDAPPLGLNEAGRVSPIRPQFLLYLTDVRGGKLVGEENRQLATRWKALFPHTVRRAVGLCDSCHATPRRFLLEKEEDRVYLPLRDGLKLGSFWSQKGQTVGNGAFLSEGRFAALSARTPAYVRAYVESWQRFVGGIRGEATSGAAGASAARRR